MWIHNNIANQNKWYFVGLFCGQGKDIANAYVVTGQHYFVKLYTIIKYNSDVNTDLTTRANPLISGEDMTKIGGNWGFQMRQPLDMHNNPCAMWHRNNAAWMKNFHHQNCATAHGVICESPLGGQEIYYRSILKFFNVLLKCVLVLFVLERRGDTEIIQKRTHAL